MTRRNMQATTQSFWIPIVFAVLVAEAGYFGAWIAHPAGGLAITGLDLAEYLQFLPPVISGQLRVNREVFYLPLFCGSLIASLLAGRREIPVILRVLLGGGAVILALAILPPAWSPTTLLDPKYRLQVIGIALCLVALPTAILLTRLTPRRLVQVAVILLSLPAAAWPAWSFLQLGTAIGEVYHQAYLPFGWSLFACVGGFLLCALFGLISALVRR